MNKKINLSIWEREFVLNIVFQNFSEEDVTSTQERAVDSLASFNFDSSLDKVKEYIMKYNSEDVDSPEITNIFKYVIPKSILIPRETERRVVALMCNYKFDMEDGIAVVFENEKYKAVGPQDIIL